MRKIMTTRQDTNNLTVRRKKYEHSKQTDTFDATIIKFETWELVVIHDVSEVF